MLEKKYKLGYLSPVIICSKKHTGFSEQIMPKDKYPSIYFTSNRAIRSESTGEGAGGCAQSPTPPWDDLRLSHTTGIKISLRPVTQLRHSSEVHPHQKKILQLKYFHTTRDLDKSEIRDLRFFRTITTPANLDFFYIYIFHARISTVESVNCFKGILPRRVKASILFKIKSWKVLKTVLVTLNCYLLLLYIRLTMKNLIGQEHSFNSQ